MRNFSEHPGIDKSHSTVADTVYIVTPHALGNSVLVFSFKSILLYGIGYVKTKLCMKYFTKILHPLPIRATSHFVHVHLLVLLELMPIDLVSEQVSFKLS